jgi:adenylosuccinate synthase
VTILRAHVVAGLGLGDEGKGSMVDWLVRVYGADTVIRYNGGAQAAHHVVLADGREHCFAQFGAGTLVPGVRTFLARFVVVDPPALRAEEQALRAIGVHDGYRRLTIDPRCVVVTPFHRIVNHMREVARGTGRHGSCGMGIGEARLDSERPGLPTLTIGDIGGDTGELQRLRARLRLLWLSKLDIAEQLLDECADGGARAELEVLLRDLRRPERVPALVEAYAEILAGVRVAMQPGAPSSVRAEPPRVVVFEGAQGVLLDRELGMWPHVTPSRTTFAHADTLLAELGPTAEVTRVGVLRAYATRHGAGPLVTEDAQLSAVRPDRHNGEQRWQGRFRLGWFDGPAARYALRAVGGVDQLVLTNLDRLDGLPQVALCSAYVGPAGERVRDIPAPTQAADGLPDGRRTAWLNGCRPVYETFSGWEEARAGGAEVRAFVEAVQGEGGCDRELATISLGPCAGDKRTIGALFGAG